MKCPACNDFGDDGDPETLDAMKVHILWYHTPPMPNNATLICLCGERVKIWRDLSHAATCPAIEQWLIEKTLSKL